MSIFRLNVTKRSIKRHFVIKPILVLIEILIIVEAISRSPFPFEIPAYSVNIRSDK